MTIASAVVDPSQHLFWLGSRSLGIVALLMAASSVGLGLALSMRIDSRPGAASRLRVVHESIALISLVAIGGHGLLLGDSFLHPTLAQVTVPFAFNYRQPWMGLGLIAGWLALAFTLSFYVRKQIGTALWRKLHRWTFLVFVLGLVHALGTGTDSRSTWLIALLGLAAAPVILLGARRLSARDRSVGIPGAGIPSRSWNSP
jgi:sulfoxide reductase heme-binding subunit YedZ